MFNRRSQTPLPEGNTRPPSTWLIVFFVSALIGYWIFVLQLERPDLSNSSWFSVVPVLFRGPIVFVAELFHWRVLRHFIPVVVGWMLASQAAVGTVRVLYGLANNSLAKQYLGQLQSGRPVSSKGVPVREKSLAKDRSKYVAIGVGGPGKINVAANEAVITEINGRLSHIWDRGGRQLARLEYVSAILDLRVQERSQADMLLVTNDGLEVKLDVTVVFCIDTDGEPRSEARPYPFNPDAAVAAAYAQTVLPDNEIQKWDAIPLIVIQGQLRQIMAQYRLDHLLPIDGVADPHSTIQRELVRRIRPILEKRGIELIELRLGRFELDQPIVDQYIRYWQTHLQTQIQAHEVEGEAEKLEAVEIARAEAELTMIQAILDGVSQAQAAGRTIGMREIVALRLIEALEKMAKQTQQVQPVSTELTHTLEGIRQALLPPQPLTPNLLPRQQEPMGAGEDDGFAYE